MTLAPWQRPSPSTQLGSHERRIRTLERLTHGGSGIRSLNLVVDGRGAALTTGIKGDVMIDFDCVITAWTLLADQSGSIVIDVWKDVFANFPPTVADSITGSDPPTLATADSASETDLSAWSDVQISAGDVIRIHVDSITTIQRVTLDLTLAG